MAKAIDNIKAWAKENVQLITILPENTILKVDTRLKDVLETSVDEKYYLSDEKTALLIAQLEEKDKVAGTIGHHPFSKKFEFSGYNSEISPTLLATDYKAPKTLLEESVALIDDTQGYDGIRVYKDETPTLRSQRSGLKVLEQSGVEYSRKTGIGKQLEVAHCLSASDWRGLNRNQKQNAVVIPVLTPDRVKKRQNGRRFKEDGDPSFTLTAQDKHGILIKEATKKGYAEAMPGDSVNYSIPTSKTRRGRVGKGIANTLDTGCQQGVVVRETEDGFHLARTDEKKSSVQGTHVTYPEGKSHCLGVAHKPMTTDGLRIRKLTPRECWRLQGFPDYTFDKAQEVNSNSQLYKQAGNSVTVNVIHEIAKRL